MENKRREDSSSQGITIVLEPGGEGSSGKQGVRTFIYNGKEFECTRERLEGKSAKAR